MTENSPSAPMTDQTAEPVVREWQGRRVDDRGNLEAWEILEIEHNALARCAEADMLRAELVLTRAALSPLDEIVHALGIEDSDDNPAEVVTALKARCAELEKYARHEDDCEDRRTYEIVDGKPVTCICGLEASLIRGG